MVRKGVQYVQGRVGPHIMAQQTSNNEMWVARRINIGPSGKPTMVL